MFMSEQRKMTRKVGRVSRFRIVTIMAMISYFFSGHAQAALVKWTLDGVTFEDTSSATGSFIHDASTDMFTEIAIVTNVATHSFSLEPSPLTTISFISSNAADLTGVTFMSFKLDSPLTDAGGIVDITLTPGGIGSHEGICGTPDSGCAPRSVERYIASGSLIGTQVPVPAAVWLFGSALGLLGWLRRVTA
jgi:hypothetical protein